MRRPVALLATLLVATACSSQDAAPPDGAGAAAPAAAAAPASASNGGDLADVAGYELTMERIDRYFAAQRAMGRRMSELSPAEREAMRLDGDDDAGGDASLDAMASRIEGNAVMRDALREADLSPREFATLTMSLVQASMAAMVAQTRPGADLDSLVRGMGANPANVRFVRDNQAALERRQAELRAELERLGVELDGDEEEEDPAA